MASTRLTRTQSSDTYNYNFTFSFWMKKSSTGATTCILATQVGNDEFRAEFDSSDRLFWYKYNANTSTFAWNLYTERRFRDPNAFYHFVLQYDSTQATASNRLKMYVNGVQETVFQSGYENYPSQNENSFAFQGGTAYIGCNENTNAHFDGILSHINMVHGSTPAYTSFGSTDSTTGEWKITTSPSVTYGSQGYFILKDGSSVTDQSGNSNNWTVANGTLTNTEDCPSNVFAVMNPLDNYYQGSTFSNGNNTVATTNSAYSYNTATIGVSSGKYYWEVKCGSGNGAYSLIGLASQLTTSNTNFLGNSNYQYGYYGNGGTYYNNNSATSYGDAYGSNDIIGVAMDLDNNKLYFSKNGVWQNSGDPTSGSTGTGAISIADPSLTVLNNYFPAVSEYDNGASYTFNVNFGNGYFGTTAVTTNSGNGYAGAEGSSIFNYQPPTGYSALSTKGLNE